MSTTYYYQNREEAPICSRAANPRAIGSYRIIWHMSPLELLKLLHDDPKTFFVGDGTYAGSLSWFLEEIKNARGEVIDWS